MIKFFRAILAAICIMVALPVAAAASGNTYCELHSIEVKSNSVVLQGRQFVDAQSPITLTAEKQSDGSASAAVSANCSADGCFSIEFAAEHTAYNLNFSVSDKNLAMQMDFSEYADLFAANADYSIDAVCFEPKVITLTGSHDAESGAGVGLKLIDGAKSGLDAIKGVAQAQSVGQNFELKFMAERGEYDLSIGAYGLEPLKTSFVIGDISDSITEKDNVDALLIKLNDFVDKLSAQLSECESKNIAVDYEKAYYAIIEKFIENIRIEQANGDVSRVGQYDYVLSKLYNEAYDNLQQYLDGKKTPFIVPKYVTGDIRTDGTTVYATTEANGVLAERPVFFVGYGHWDTAAAEIPFLSDIGANITSSSVYMDDVIKSYNAEGWDFSILSSKPDRSMTIKAAQEDKASGEWSIKMTTKTTDDPEAFSRLEQYIDIKPNTEYVFGLKTKGNGTSVWVSLDGLAKAQDREYLQNTQEWHTYEFEYTSDDEPIGLFNIYAESDVTSPLYIDDIYVKEKGSDINLLRNGDFEAAARQLTADETEAAEQGWYVDRREFERLRGIFENAEEYNVLVGGGADSTTPPEFILASDPDATTASSHFVPYKIDNQTIRNLLSVYGRICADVHNDYDSVYDMLLMNEPKVHTNDGSYNDGVTPYKQRWAEWLEKKYGNISALNAKYGTRYSSFESVTMPNGVERNIKYYDYRSFNDEVLSEFINWYIDEMQTSYPELKYHVKIMQYLRYDYPNYFRDGTNYELVADNMDLNGCDGYGAPDDANRPLTFKMAWYDMLTSLSDKPVWDTENHILSDKSVVEYDSITPEYVGADIWNGAVHGRGASVNWTYDRSKQSQPWGNSQFVNTNFAFRPEEMAEVSKTTLDLNRLSNEITAISKEQAKVAILYSRTSIGYNGNHMTQVAEAYEQAIFSGQKVGFITDSNSEDVSKYELLIVPEATNVPSNVVDNIYSFVQNGGKLILLGSNSLRYDEANNSHNATKLNYILGGAEPGTVADVIENMNITEVVLRDADTGEKLDDVEWSYAEYDGQYVVNILNYDMESSKNIGVYVDGEQIANLTELRSGKTSDTLLAKPMQAMLVAFDIQTFTFDMVDEGGEVIKSDVSTLEAGKITCTSDVDGSLILALYKDDVLIDVTIGTGMIEFSPEDGSDDYRLMATAWNMENIEPLARSRKLIYAK